MQTLEEHNNARRQELASGAKPRRNGIACPKCGSELMDTAPNTMLTSNPPQKHVGCQCGWTGYALI